MKKTFNLILITCFSSLIFSACSKKNDSEKSEHETNIASTNNEDKVSTIEVIVFDKHVPFHHPLIEEPIDALKIKETNSDTWQVVPAIKGFNFEENNEYKLKLKKTVLANPPMDASNTTYELIEIISKTPK